MGSPGVGTGAGVGKGEEVGLAVGCAVGFAVDLAVGLAVGFDVGLFVGLVTTGVGIGVWLSVAVIKGVCTAVLAGVAVAAKVPVGRVAVSSAVCVGTGVGVFCCKEAGVAQAERVNNRKTKKSTKGRKGFFIGRFLSSKFSPTI